MLSHYLIQAFFCHRDSALILNIHITFIYQKLLRIVFIQLFGNLSYWLHWFVFVPVFCISVSKVWIEKKRSVTMVSVSFANLTLRNFISLWLWFDAIIPLIFVRSIMLSQFLLWTGFGFHIYGLIGKAAGSLLVYKFREDFWCLRCFFCRFLFDFGSSILRYIGFWFLMFILFSWAYGYRLSIVPF